MPKMKDSTIEILEPIAIPDTLQSKLTTSFSGEVPSFRESIEKEAKVAKMNPVDYYATLLFQQILDSRYEQAIKRQEKILEKYRVAMKYTIDLMVTTGQATDSTDALRKMGFGA